MKRILAASLFLATTGVPGVAGTAAAATINITGFGASSNAPLAATLDYQITDDTLRLTLTNTAVDAGLNNRITYFGLQMPTDGVEIKFATSDSTAWTLNQNAKLPGAGANTFSWLFETTKGRANAGGGDAVGLNLNESLTIDITSSSPLADIFDWQNWDPTTKHSYLFGAKYQTVGNNGQDSGVAHTVGLVSSTPIPEPSTMALMLLGGLLVTQRKVRRPTSAS